MKTGFTNALHFCRLMFHSRKFAAGIKHSGVYISCDKADISARAPMMLELNPTSARSGLDVTFGTNGTFY